MHNLSAIFAKYLEICKEFSKEIVNDKGNIPRRGVIPRFSDLEVVAMSMAAEHLSIDSENSLFYRLSDYKRDFPYLISRRQYNNRRKFTRNLCKEIRRRISVKMDGEEYFCVDSKPIEVCRLARGSRIWILCHTGCLLLCDYKLHVVCGLSGVIHFYDLTPANVHDINYMKDIKFEFQNCSILGDRAYLSAELQQDLFSSVGIKLEVPYRLNIKN